LDKDKGRFNWIPDAIEELPGYARILLEESKTYISFYCKLKNLLTKTRSFSAKLYPSFFKFPIIFSCFVKLLIYYLMGCSLKTLIDFFPLLISS